MAPDDIQLKEKVDVRSDNASDAVSKRFHHNSLKQKHWNEYCCSFKQKSLLHYK